MIRGVRQRLWLVFLAVVAFGWGGLTFLKSQEPQMSETSEASKDPIEEFTEATDITLPPSAQIIGVSTMAGIDSLLRAKITLAADEVARLLLDLGLGPDAFNPEDQYLLGPDQAWWTPQKAAKLPTASGRTGAGLVFYLGIDRSGGEEAVLYYVQHSL